jgi:hypothetical protein
MKTLSGTVLGVMATALFPMWAQGSYVPLRFSRAAVERDAEDHIRLTPARR